MNGVELGYSLEFERLLDVSRADMKERLLNKAQEFHEVGLEVDNRTPTFTVPGGRNLGFWSGLCQGHFFQK